MRILKITFLLSFFFIAFSCSKSETTTVTPKTPAELLAGTTSKSWKMTKATALGLDFFTNSVFSTYNKPCIVDNLLVFKKDGTYQITEGATKCSASDADLILTDKWALSADGKTLRVNQFTFAGKTLTNVDFLITTITETAIETSTTVSYQGVTVPATITFTAI